MKKLLKIVLILLGTVTGLACIGILILTLTAYDPEAKESAEASLQSARLLSVSDSIRILSWNTGYGGLDKSVDFFMDGGTMTFPASQSVVEQNVSAISSFLTSRQSDICLLQEVDLDSSRTKHLDELQLELETHVFPELEGIRSCENTGNVLEIVIDSEHYIASRAVIIRYFDRELFLFVKQ